MDLVSIASVMSETTLAEVMSCTSRQTREMVYARMNVKAKKKRLLSRFGQKKDERLKKLHEKFQKFSDQKEGDLYQELVRTWLYTKRSMLKAALDFLEIPNDNGLVDDDTDFFAELTPEQVRALKTHLETLFPKEHVQIYLFFVDTPHLNLINQ